MHTCISVFGNFWCIKKRGLCVYLLVCELSKGRVRCSTIFSLWLTHSLPSVMANIQLIKSWLACTCNRQKVIYPVHVLLVCIAGKAQYYYWSYYLRSNCVTNLNILCGTPHAESYEDTDHLLDNNQQYKLLHVHVVHCSNDNYCNIPMMSTN